jgi:hypothetical protein
MKKFLLILFFWTGKFASNATVFTWDGEAGDGLWLTATNWSTDLAPGAGDSVLLDNSIAGSTYTVTLPSGNSLVSLASLIIMPSLPSVIILVLPNSNSSDPGLHITGTGDAFILNDGAIFRNRSGAITGSGLLVVSTFRINNGGRYIHNTSRGNAAIVACLSNAPGTELGVFEFDPPVAGYTISLSGRVYGSLELSAVTKGDSVSYVGNAATPLHINGNLKINSHVSLSINFSADFHVHKRYEQSSSSTFDIQSGTASNLVKIGGNLSCAGIITETGMGSPMIECNGTSNQEISLTGSFHNQVSLRINNPAGVAAVSPILIPYRVDFINGKFHTDSVNILRMANNSTYSGGSTLSFVHGPMKKIGNQDFSFPIGKGSIYAPASISAVSAASPTDEFFAEYMRENPQSRYGNIFRDTVPAAAIDHISYVEYWKIRSYSASSVTASITLNVNCESFCMDFQRLFIVALHTSSGEWQNRGSEAASFSSPPQCPGYLRGFIRSVPVDQFQIFTLGTGDSYTANPLPLVLLSFQVWMTNSGYACAQWEVGNSSRGTRFELKRGISTSDFETIGYMRATDTGSSYRLEDLSIGEATYFYRLKIISESDGITYSQIVSLSNFPKELLTLSIAPSVISSEARISIVCSKKELVEWRITDILGRSVRRGKEWVPSGGTIIRVQLNDLSPGIYFLIGMTTTGTSKTIRFIKNSP